MPTEQPSPPTDVAADAADRETAAGVLNDETLDRTPGGGGLGGASAADPLGGSARGQGGPGPNAPGDTGEAPTGAPEREAQGQALEQVANHGGRSAGGGASAG